MVSETGCYMYMCSWQLGARGLTVEGTIGLTIHHALYIATGKGWRDIARKTYETWRKNLPAKLSSNTELAPGQCSTHRTCLVIRTQHNQQSRVSSTGPLCGHILRRLYRTSCSFWLLFHTPSVPLTNSDSFHHVSRWFFKITILNY